MANIEKRIEKLENHEEAISPKNIIIFKLCYGGLKPTEEEVEAATKKFQEEHPGYRGHIVLDFMHLHFKERITPK